MDSAWAVTVPTLAAAPVALAAGTAQAGVSPRLAELKAEFDEAADYFDSLSDNEDWEAALDTVQEIGFEIMREPVASPGDFLVELAVWERACRTEDEDGDLSSRIGWHHNAPFRLITDAGKLLGGAA